MNNALILCEKLSDFFKCKEKHGGEIPIILDMIRETEKYGFPMFMIIEGDELDWCVDMDCGRCKAECIEYKRITAEHYLTNGRIDKLKRVMK